MDKLIVKNFGPIKDISIDVNDINIFIGPTSSGKSTIAKLIAIFINPDFATNYSLSAFADYLTDYNIFFPITNDTYIKYSTGQASWELKGGNFSYNILPAHNLFWPVYLPAERALLPNVGESIFGLISNKVSLPHVLVQFGTHFEISRSNLKTLDIRLFKVQYEYSDRNNYVTLANGTKVKLETTASGIQSTVPMMLVINYYCNIKRPVNNFFIVEEPEMNLYPTMQKQLIEFIVGSVQHSGDRLIITTHSPYTLTAIDNLIQAKNAFDKHPELKEEINNVVPERLWLDFNKVACYYFEDGYCRSTLDNEYQSIGPSNIDDVSEDLGKTFDQLLDLKYKD